MSELHELAAARQKEESTQPVRRSSRRRVVALVQQYLAVVGLRSLILQIIVVVWTLLCINYIFFCDLIERYPGEYVNADFTSELLMAWGAVCIPAGITAIVLLKRK